jgi:hypothetical protein
VAKRLDRRQQFDAGGACFNILLQIVRIARAQRIDMIGKPPETIHVRLEGSILIIFVEDFTHGVGPKAASADLNPHIGCTVADQESFAYTPQIHCRQCVFDRGGSGNVFRDIILSFQGSIEHVQVCIDCAETLGGFLWFRDVLLIGEILCEHATGYASGPDAGQECSSIHRAPLMSSHRQAWPSLHGFV